MDGSDQNIKKYIPQEIEKRHPDLHLSFGELFVWVVCTILTISFLSTFAEHGGDFTQDYASGVALRAHQSIYGPFISHHASQVLGHDGVNNFHPPFVSILSTFWTLFPFREANLGLEAVLVAVNFWVLMSFARMILPYVPKLRYAVPFLLLWFPFLRGEVELTLSPFIAGGVLLSWRFIRDQKNILAGIIVGLISSLKLYPLFLLLFFVVTKRWNGLAAAMVVFLSIIFLSIGIVGWEDCSFYVTHVISRDVLEWGVFPVNTSITGFLLPLMMENGWVENILSNMWAAYMVKGVASLLIIGGTLWGLLHSSARLDYRFGLVCAAMILLSPIMWAHGLVIALFPLSFLVLGQVRGELSMKWGFVHVHELLLGAFVFLSLPDVWMARGMLEFIAPGKIPIGLYLVLKLPVFGVLILWCLSLIAVRQSKSCRTAPTNSSMPHSQSPELSLHWQGEHQHELVHSRS